MRPDIDVVVVGAGVVGLAIARALSARGHEVMVIERHARIGSETSSRSSEVIHAGLYYPPGSLRARLCVEGRRKLYAFARENNVAHKMLGKLLVATHDDDVPALEAIAERARANGVTDLVRLGAHEVRAREPELRCVSAYLSPSTGVIDSHGLMAALETHIVGHGGSIVLNTSVTGLARTGDAFHVTTDSQGEISTVTARCVVSAAGLGATVVGRMLGGRPGYSVPQTYPARGHYYALTTKAPFTHLVYPMPKGAWLGVHLTLDTAGAAKFGPDIEWCETTDVAFDEKDGLRRKTFEAEIRRYWPGLPDQALTPGYVGIRPKIYRVGEPAADFAIHDETQHGIGGLVALYGIESPGLTSSLAIGDYVADKLK